MDSGARAELLRIADSRQVKDDPSHDFAHVRRVAYLADRIAEAEGADRDVVYAAALFHDTVVYRKDSPQSHNESEESAAVAGETLRAVPGFPQEKITAVGQCIRECSFSKALAPSSPESSALQDADLLESTGAIAIARTFSSGGQMGRKFYDPTDPFRRAGEPKFSSGKAVATSLDLFYARLLKAKDRIHGAYARGIADRRAAFLEAFLRELELELGESGELPAYDAR